MCAPSSVEFDEVKKDLTEDQRFDLSVGALERAEKILKMPFSANISVYAHLRNEMLKFLKPNSKTLEDQQRVVMGLLTIVILFTDQMGLNREDLQAALGEIHDSFTVVRETESVIVARNEYFGFDNA